MPNFLRNTRALDSNFVSGIIASTTLRRERTSKSIGWLHSMGAVQSLALGGKIVWCSYGEGGGSQEESKAVPVMSGWYCLVHFQESWEVEPRATSGATRDKEQVLCYAVIAAQN